MALLNLLFGFHGRIGRGQFWLVVAVWAGVLLALFLVFGGMSLVLGIELPSSVNYAVSIIVYIPMMISDLAIGIKRLHDRNKTASWLVVFYLVPLAAFCWAGMAEGGTLQNIVSSLGLLFLIWAFVELGCRRGSIGGNPHGPDPVAPKPAVH